MSYIRIQLVEDDATSVELIKEALKEAQVPHNLTVHSDGEAALDDLKRNPVKPHIIMLDLNLPKKSGLDVLKAIKKNKALKAIPVIILTNSKSQDDVVKAYSNYCNAYIRKPFGFDKLVEAIKATRAFWFETATLPEDPQRTSKPPSQ